MVAFARATTYTNGVMVNLLLSNVRVLDPGNARDEVVDVAVRSGVIQPPGAPIDDLPRIDASGMLLTPGLWDVHVHFRDPGNGRAEDALSGAQAAAAGGFTRVTTMPNTMPAGDNPVWVRNQVEAQLPVKILPAPCITKERRGLEVADLEALAAAGAAAFTDDGAMVADEEIMRTAMRRAAALGKPVMEHAVVPSIAGPGIIRDSPLARRLNLPLFPPEAEVRAVLRDIQLCRETGCATHIQHISCADSVAAIRAARAEGLPVTGEASPHHLALAVEDIPGDDGNYRMNPPLGNRADVRALRAGVLDGTLTIYATDHAPHTADTKVKGFLKASFGVIGLETAIGVSWQVMVEEEGQTPLAWVAGWTTGPAALLGMPVPTLTPGCLADFTLIDTSRAWRVDPTAFKSRARNTPFAGWELHARAVMTVCDGKLTHSHTASWGV